MRCLVKHQWVMENAFHIKSRVPYVRHILPYRTCACCGTMQRGGYDPYSGQVTWETMRERVYIKSEQLPIVRRRTSWLDQWTHTLGLRRSRMRDKAIIGKRPGLNRL